MDHLRPEYQRYIHSPQWRVFAQQIRRRDGHRCRQCGARGHLDVHHLTYTRFGRERPDDVITLCRPCHDAAHGRVPVSVAPASGSGFLFALALGVIVIILLVVLAHFHR